MTKGSWWTLFVIIVLMGIARNEDGQFIIAMVGFYVMYLFEKADKEEKENRPEYKEALRKIEEERERNYERYVNKCAEEAYEHHLKKQKEEEAKKKRSQEEK